MLSAAGALRMSVFLLHFSYIASRFIMRQALRINSDMRIKSFAKKQAKSKMQFMKDALTFKNKFGTVVLYFLFCNFFNFSNSENTFFNILLFQKIDKKYINIFAEDYFLNDVLFQFAKIENINVLKLEKLVKFMTIFEYYIKNPSEFNKLKLVQFFKYILGKTMGINSDEDRKQIEEKMEEVRLNFFPEKEEMISAIKKNIVGVSDEEILISISLINILNLVVSNMPELIGLITNGINYEDKEKTLQALDTLIHTDREAEINIFKRKNKHELDKILNSILPHLNVDGESPNTNIGNRPNN